MAVEFPPPQEKILENARIAAEYLRIPVCISIILFLQTVAHPKKIKIGDKEPKARSEEVSIAKTYAAGDQTSPSGFSKMNNKDKIVLANANPSRFIDMYGALPLFRDNLKIGAIGVSGGTKMQDLAICFYSLKKSGFEVQKEWFKMFENLEEVEKDELQAYFDDLGLFDILS